MLAIALISIGVLVALVVSAAVTEYDPWAVPPQPVWPIPQQAEYANDRLILIDAVIVVPEGDERAQYPGRLLSELIQDEYMVPIPVVVGKAPEGKTKIVVGEISQSVVAAAAGRGAAPEKAEGYHLRVDDSGAVITGTDYRGTLYGVSSFIQLVHRWGNQSIAVRKATIKDWPFLRYRWVHVYIPGKENLPFARRYMRDFLLRYKFNGMILEVGAGMRLDRHPEINTQWARTTREWYARGEGILKFDTASPLGPANRLQNSCHPGIGLRGYIEKRELRAFADDAERFGLEIVPEIQSLPHTYWLCCAHREVAELPESDWPDAYCPSNLATYELLFDIMDEYIEVLRPKAVHIGHDEWRAGAFCPRCKGKDTGELFAADVLKIYGWLKKRGIETWMWGDHFIDSHNRLARSKHEGTVVRYEYPGTEKARDIIAAAAKDIHITNWTGEAGDEVFKGLGWPYILGNFCGSDEQDWPGRVERGGLVGAEVSSWCAMDEFQLAKLNTPEAAYTSNLLWSSHYPAKEDAFEEVSRIIPQARARLAGVPMPSAKATPMRFEVIDIRAAYNHPPKGEGWDLSGVPAGNGYCSGIPYRIGDPATNGGNSVVLISRRAGESVPTEAVLPVKGRYASLVFVHSATEKGRRSIHAGDHAQFPREASELIGLYEIRYADGLVAAHEIRYDETLAAWDAGLGVPYYFTIPIVTGTLPDGRKAVIWGSEWANPRPDVPIVSVKLIGAPGRSNADPILFGVTGVEKPRVEDYR